MIICVLLPPLFYVFSIQLLEKAIHSRYDKELDKVYIGDTRRLFDGSKRLEEVIQENVDAFLISRKLPNWGVNVQVTVKTSGGVYLYPTLYDDSKSDLSSLDSIAVAKENYKLLNEGLKRTLDVKIEHNTSISNSILLMWMFVFSGVVFLFYRRGTRLFHEDEKVKQQNIDYLYSERRKSQLELERIKSDRIKLIENIERMNAELTRERKKVSATEDEILNELVAMEEKIQQKTNQQSQFVKEIEALKEKIGKLEKKNFNKKSEYTRSTDALKKRFRTIYKNITFQDRAIDGFSELTEAMKIKAEEVIHKLNDDHTMVPIKRKVFGNKKISTIFEVIFAYKGRLYYRTFSGNRLEVLSIGTKLTQKKDLAFLEDI